MRVSSAVMSIEAPRATEHTRYRANEPRIVSENLDGQALIIDMGVGTYFSCDGVSSEAWAALTNGATPAELAAWLQREYGADAGSVDSDVARFVDALVADGVVVERGELAVAAELFPPSGGSGPYDGLAVERFSDLADLILLDPVHDVTEAGWPHATE